MTPTSHQLAMIIVMAVGVILLRALPFLIFRGEHATLPPILEYLGRVMTAAAIAMLVVYSYTGLCDFANPQYMRLVKAIPATAITIALQLFGKNPLLSICGGTVVYMWLVQSAGC